jgi:thioredoxin-dependent peroxiredoxin
MSKSEDQAIPPKSSAPIRLAKDAELRQIGNDASASTASQSSNLRGERASSSAQARRKEKVQVGNLIPDFTLLNQSGAPVSLSNFLGKKHIVLYFYPKDNTSLCTEEACAFRDSYEVFKDAGAEIIGVSSDSVQSHRQFAQEHQLPFILLSDVDGVIRKRFGVPIAFGLPGRVTYIIDRKGIVRRIFFSQFTSKRHVDEALQTLRWISEEHM